MNDTLILEIAIRKLSERFDEFIGKVLESDVSQGDIMKARACLPSYCEHSLKRRED